MDGEKKEEPKQVCHIDILFPVTSDEDALKVKNIIRDALKDVEHKRFMFQIVET